MASAPGGIPRGKNILAKIKKFFLVALVFLILFSTPVMTPKAEAYYSWPDIIGFSYKEMLEQLFIKIQGMIMGMMKQQAIQTINKQVDSMISGGGSGNAKFITDWETYLYKTPDNNTKLYMNDYLSQITSGKGSLGSYSSEGFGSGSSYASQLVSAAKSNTISKKDPTFSYEGNPANMFSGGNFKNFNLYLSGINNPWAFDINAQNEFEKKKAEERKLAAVKSQAYLGGIGAGEGTNGKGTINLPGSVIMQTKANTMDLGNKVLASASHPEEMVTSLVSKILTQAMNQGMSSLGSSNISSSLSGLNPSSFYSSSNTLSSGSYSSSSYSSSGSSGGGSMLDTMTSAQSANNSSGSSGSTSTTSSSSSGFPPPERNF